MKTVVKDEHGNTYVSSGGFILPMGNVRIADAVARKIAQTVTLQ